MSIHKAKPEHEVFYQDIIKLIAKHGDKIDAKEMLAVAGNMLGKLIALQDQRTMTPKEAVEIVVKNIEYGNQQAFDELHKTKGRA